jgi:hypothetical protein
MATAMPRRLFHHSAVSASKGAKVDELPSKPSNKPCASAKVQMLPDIPAHTKPAVTAAAPTHSTGVMPCLSAKRPVINAAQTQGQHHHGVRQRRIGPAHTKLGLHRRQDHRDHIHAAVAQGHQAQSRQQAPSGVAGVDQVG